MEKYVEEYMECIVGQTYKDFTLVVINDDFPLNIDKIVKKYKIESIIINQSSSPQKNRLVGLKKCFDRDFDIVVCSDSDETMYADRIEQNIVHELFKEAVSIEKEFVNDSIKVRMIGMNSDLMNEYIQFVADRLLQQLNYDKIYNSKNPFPFMNMISIDTKVNFFEKIRFNSRHHNPVTKYLDPLLQLNMGIYKLMK